jgi:hypothetical protein
MMARHHQQDVASLEIGDRRVAAALSDENSPSLTWATRLHFVMVRLRDARPTRPPPPPERGRKWKHRHQT